MAEASSGTKLIDTQVAYRAEPEGVGRIFVDPFVVKSGQEVALGGKLGSAMMEQRFRVEIIDVP